MEICEIVLFSNRNYRKSHFYYIEDVMCDYFADSSVSSAWLPS